MILPPLSHFSKPWIPPTKPALIPTFLPPAKPPGLSPTANQSPSFPYYLPSQVFQVNSLPGEFNWKNPLKTLFHNRQAIIYALHLRTFAAQDKNGDGRIDPLLGENGNFLRAIPQLGYLKSLGVNTIHLLPINPIGKIDRLGELGSPGSAYAPLAYDRLNEEYDEPNNGLTVVQEARVFVNECHKLGINVMVDIPSCASVDLALQRPDLILKDSQGKPVTPTNWVDIRMFVPDSPELRAYYQKFFDLMVNKLGVDGFRADIARARTPEFWNHFISKYPDKAWLAESYTEEDDSPLPGLPRDIPETLLKAGFDSYYGQYHIFHNMDAKTYMRYLLQNQALFERNGGKKSIIGSFLTHDDPSTMQQGGALYCKLVSGLMMTQPDTNPYILNGFETGFPEHFNIFDWRPRPAGKNPDIEAFLRQMILLRNHPVYGAILCKGRFIPLRATSQDSKGDSVIAFMRQLGSKTLMIVANKDMNSNHLATIEVPGLSLEQPLVNLAPNYGEPSSFLVNSTQTIQANLSRGRFYLFEINVPPYTGPIQV